MKQKTVMFGGILIAGLAVAAGTALAAMPVLSVSQDGNSYALTVNNADGNAFIDLYEKQSSSLWSIITKWAQADSSGHISQSMSLAFDGSSNPLQLYVQQEGNGLQSSTVQVYSSGTCANNCGTGVLSLSQMNVSINSGQTNVITAYPTSGAITVSSNSNPQVAGYSLSGNQITVSGLTTGGAQIVVCASGGSQCNTIVVSVNGGSSSGITFSNSSPILTFGQSQAINIYSSAGGSNGNSNNFSVSSNSNPAAVNASLSGSVLTLTGQGVGNATISVCQTGSSFCGNVVVTVGSTSGTGNITVGQNSLSLTPGQSGTVSVSNAAGSLYISNNSNNSVVSAGISGQSVSIYAIAAGSSTVSICQNGYGGCVSIYVTVSGSNNSISGTLSFSTANPVLTLGQNQSVTIYSPNGSGSFYISSNSNSNAVSAAINGSTLSLFGQNTGASTVNICATGYAYCGNVYATVNGYSGGVSFSQSTVNLNIGQNQTVAVSGGSAGFVLTSNTSPNVAQASMTGGSLYLTALNNGSSTLTVCQSGNTSACGQISVLVGGVASSSGNIVTFSNNNPSLTVGQSLIVNIYATNGYSGGYAMSGNTNPAAAAVNISGSSLNLIGSTGGSSVLTVCQTGSPICGSLSVSVTVSSTSPIVFSSAFSANPIPIAVVGIPYNYQLRATGGSGALVFMVASGSLPSSLTLSGSGTISGTPNSISGSNFTVKVTDASGNSAAQNFAILFKGDQPYPTLSPSYPNGQLINESGTISIVYKNTKTLFANAAAFLGLGFNFKNVTAASNSGLMSSGKVVITAKGAHPRGSWLLAGKAVYFLTPDGLIAVPDWNTFLGNGGQAGFLVKANSYDLALARLPLMAASDARLK